MDIDFFSVFVFVDLQISISIDSCIHLSDHGSAQSCSRVWMARHQITGRDFDVNYRRGPFPILGNCMPVITFLALIGYASPQGICKISTKGLIAEMLRRVSRPDNTTPSAAFTRETYEYTRGVGSSAGGDGNVDIHSWVLACCQWTMLEFYSTDNGLRCFRLGLFALGKRE